MTNEVKLGRVIEVLEELSYPITRIDAATALDEYTVRHAGGEVNLGALISETGGDSYDSATDLEAELHNVLPLETVGEPGQSEGEG